MQDQYITVEDYKRYRDSLTDVNNIQDEMHRRLDLKIEEVQNQIAFEIASHQQRLSHLQATLVAFQETSLDVEKFKESVQSRHGVLKELDSEPRPELKPVSRFPEHALNVAAISTEGNGLVSNQPPSVDMDEFEREINEAFGGDSETQQ